MTFLNLLPQPLRVKLILSAVAEVFDQLEAQHVGQLLNEALDQRVGKDLADKSQKRLAKWLRQVAEEVEA